MHNPSLYMPKVRDSYSSSSSHCNNQQHIQALRRENKSFFIFARCEQLHAQIHPNSLFYKVCIAAYKLFCTYRWAQFIFQSVLFLLKYKLSLSALTIECFLNLQFGSKGTNEFGKTLKYDTWRSSFLSFILFFSWLSFLPILGLDTCGYIRWVPILWNLFMSINIKVCIYIYEKLFNVSCRLWKQNCFCYFHIRNLLMRVMLI